MWMRSLNGESDGKGKMKEKLRLAVFSHKRWSREGGVEIGDRGKRAVHTDGAAGLAGDMLQQIGTSCERCGI